MPFKSHKIAILPDDPNVALWRYMDFTKFVSMLEHSGLYFARADLLGDPFEGSIPSKFVAERSEFFKAAGLPVDAGAHLAATDTKAFQLMRQVYCVNCWHTNEAESAAMWQLYAKSDEAIAIRTTYKRLSDSIPEAPDILASLVNYIDYERQSFPSGNVLIPLLHKRLSFEHERELRLVYLPQTGSDFIHRWLQDNSVEPRESGWWAVVDLTDLIDHVYIAPGAPGWLRELVEKVVKRYGYSFPVEQSALGGDPIF